MVKFYSAISGFSFVYFRDFQFVRDTEGAFFWGSSRIGILGIDGICVLLRAI